MPPKELYEKNPRAVVCACMIICRVKALAYAGENNKVFLKTQMLYAATLIYKLFRHYHHYAPSHTVNSKRSPSSFDRSWNKGSQSPMPDFVPLEPKYPTVLPGSSFSSHSVRAIRESEVVTKTDIIGYCRDSVPLSDFVFLVSSDDGEGEEMTRVELIMSRGKQRMFHCVC